MKKVFALVLTLTILCCTVFCFPAGASEVTKVTIEKLDNGDYIETIITYYETDDRAATKSGSKTNSYKNSNDETLWSVTVYGTFTYNGTTSSCTSVSHSASAYADGWSIKNSSSSKSGYCATATATATQKKLLSSKDYSMTVNLYCSPYGILS
ncbi:MAG: hypothetical protein IJF19_03160 [Clostridia bacterium]|nr:hypothetical protein [Clostridia bacterium]